jgi:hypothetical protein
MDDEELLRRFESCTLTHDQWNHEAHIRVAFLYIRANPFETALDCIRSGIQRLNAAHEVPEGPTRGYNETTTRAFAVIIASTIAAYGVEMPTPTSTDFCKTHPHLLQKTLLRLFYSPSRRMDPRAKKRFLRPDLANLPRMS